MGGDSSENSRTAIVSCEEEKQYQKGGTDLQRKGLTTIKRRHSANKARCYQMHTRVQQWILTALSRPDVCLKVAVLVKGVVELGSARRTTLSVSLLSFMSKQTRTHIQSPRL